MSVVEWEQIGDTYYTVGPRHMTIYSKDDVWRVVATYQGIIQCLGTFTDLDEAKKFAEVIYLTGASQ